MEKDLIIKALECCGAYSHGQPCNECPYMHIELADNEICSNRMSVDALALIKEITEENEKIGIENFNLVCELSRIKEDTVRKMQERLKEDLKHYPQRCGDCFKEKVDQIAKEMLEGL